MSENAEASTIGASMSETKAATGLEEVLKGGVASNDTRRLIYIPLVVDNHIKKMAIDNNMKANTIVLDMIIDGMNKNGNRIGMPKTVDELTSFITEAVELACLSNQKWGEDE